MNTLLRIALLFLGFPSQACAQPPAPQPQLLTESLRARQDAAVAKLAWQQHLADNQRKIKNGDTGRLVIAVKPRPGHALPPNLRARVTERVPLHAQPGAGIQITHHFVQTGNVVDGHITVTGIPIGLALDVEIWPGDESAPPSRYNIAGPTKRGQATALSTSPAQPFPLLAGRLLDAAGDAICNQDLALELGTKKLLYQMQVRTDGEGRFLTPVRVTPHDLPGQINRSPPAAITAVRGKLIRKGSYRLWTTEMPAGVCATAQIYWPWAVLTDIGDLRFAAK
tara:strand:- start:455 stop:1297 length:843 start_codon:yes stop_codon:yes gene_type:complete